MGGRMSTGDVMEVIQHHEFEVQGEIHRLNKRIEHLENISARPVHRQPKDESLILKVAPEVLSVGLISIICPIIVSHLLEGKSHYFIQDFVDGTKSATNKAVTSVTTVLHRITGYFAGLFFGHLQRSMDKTIAQASEDIKNQLALKLEATDRRVQHLIININKQQDQEVGEQITELRNQLNNLQTTVQRAPAPNSSDVKRT